MAARGPGRGYQGVSFDALKTQRTLGEYPDGEWINLRCLKCPRSGRVSRARMLAQHGPDIGLNTLLIRYLAPKDCPENKPDPQGVNRCGACFGDLTG
jgi:hypothetical protein